MNKTEEMKRLIKEWDEISKTDMFATTDKGSEAFNKMWDFAKENGFVNENGTITVK